MRGAGQGQEQGRQQMQSVLWRLSERNRGGSVVCTCREPGRVSSNGRGHGRGMVSLKDQGVSSVMQSCGCTRDINNMKCGITGVVVVLV